MHIPESLAATSSVYRDDATDNKLCWYCQRRVTKVARSAKLMLRRVQLFVSTRTISGSDDGAFHATTQVCKAAKDNLPHGITLGRHAACILLGNHTTDSISFNRSNTHRTHCSLDRFTSSVPGSVACLVLHVKRFRSKLTSCWMRASTPGKSPTPLCRCCTTTLTTTVSASMFRYENLQIINSGV